MTEFRAAYQGLRSCYNWCMIGALFEVLFYAAIEGAWHGVTHAWQKHAEDPRNPCPAGPKDWRNDPVYKRNLQRLIERNREFEEARK